MSVTADPYIESAERLCATLERLGDAMATLDQATLLETEESLGNLVAILTSGAAPERASELEPIVRRGRAALLRCRRLGASFATTARVRLQVCTNPGPYGREGDLVERIPSSTALEATV